MDMLLAAAVPLSKIINSTFGSGELKGFDEALVDRIYEKFEQLYPHNRLVESDNILCFYPKDAWIDPTGEYPRYEYMTNKAFRFSHSGRVRFEMDVGILGGGATYTVYLCDSNGQPIQEVYRELSSSTRVVIESFDVEKNTDYKFWLSIIDAGFDEPLTIEQPELRICATFDNEVSQINYI